MNYPPASSSAFPSSARALDTDSEFEELSAPSDDETSASELLGESDDDEAIHFTRQSELNKLLAQAQASKQDADALRSVLDDLRKERDEALRTSRSLHETVASLRRQADLSLQEREKAATSYLSEISRLQSEIQSLHDSNDELSKRHDMATTSLRGLELDMATLRQVSEDRYNALKQDRDAIHISFVEREALIEHVTLEKDILAKDLAEKTAEAQRLEQGMQTLRAEKDKILRIAQSKAERHYMEKKEAERVSMEKADIEQALENFRSENQALLMKFDLESQQFTQQNRDLSDQVESQQDKINNLNEEIADLRRVDEDRRAMFSQLQKSHHLLRNAHDPIQHEVEKLRGELKTITQQKEDLQKRESSLYSELKISGKRLREEQEKRNETLMRLERIKQEKLMSERTMSSRISTLEREKMDALMDAQKYKTRVKRLQLKTTMAFPALPGEIHPQLD